MDDAAAPITPYIYWIVFDIPQATTDIQSGPSLPPGAGLRITAWGRPVTTRRARTAQRRYRFTVYALKSTLNLPNGTPTLSAWMAIANAAIARGRKAMTADP